MMGYFDGLQPISGEAPPPAPPPPALQNTDDQPPQQHGGYFDGLQPITPPAENANRALIQAAQDGQSPDQAATAMKVANDLGVGLPAVQGNLPDYQAQAEVKANQALLRDNPLLANWLGRNPQAVPIARDDLFTLANVSKQLKGLADMPAAAWTGIESGYYQYKSGEAGEEEFWNRAVTKNPDAAQRAREAGDVFDTKLGDLPKYTGPAEALQSTVSLLTQQAMSSLYGGSAGIVGGGAIGAVGTAEAGGVGIVPGMIGGFGIGTETDMAMNMAGQQYRALANVRGLDGQPLSEEARQAATIGTGLMAAVLQAKLGPMSSKVFDFKRVLQAVQDEAIKPGFLSRAATMAGRTMLGSAKMGGVMGSFELGSIMMEEMAKALSPGEFSHDPQEMIDRLRGAIGNGMAVGAMMHGSSEGLALLGNMRSADRAQQAHDAIVDVLNGSSQSKLRDRNAMAFRSFLQSQTDGTPVENVYLPDHVVRKLYQDGKIQMGSADDPLKFVTNMADQLADAEKVGGADIVIPTADFINNLAGNKVGTQFLADLKVGPNADSLNDKLAFDKERQEQLKDAIAAAEASAPEDMSPQDKVYHELFAALTKAGEPVERAREVAMINAQRYNARAVRMNEGFAEVGPYKPTDAYQELQRSQLTFMRASGTGEGGLEQDFWHGSPHEHEGFSNDAIGSGQGAARYGWGHYLAENPTVSREYQRELARHSIHIGGVEHKNIVIRPGDAATPETIRQENVDSLHHEMVDGDLRVPPAEAIKRHAATLVERIKNLQIQEARFNDFVGGSKHLSPEAHKAHEEGQKFYDEQLDEAKRTLDDLRDIASKGIEVKTKSYHYKVEIADETVAKMLLHDKALAEQPEVVRNLVAQHPEIFGPSRPWTWAADEGTKGNELYDRLAVAMERQHGEQIDGGQRLASEWLDQRGVPGIRYLDEGSRFLLPDQTPTHNVVVFNGDNIQLKERENAQGVKRFFQSILSPDAPARQPPNSPGALPTRISPQGEPLSNVLLSNLDAARQDPEHLQKIVDAVAREPGMEGARNIQGTENKLRWIVRKMRDNILAVHDAMEATVRERAKLWYQGGRNIAERLGQRWGRTTEQVAGMIAALSPQKDWFMNTSMAERVGDIMTHQMDHVFDEGMLAAAFRFRLADENRADQSVTEALDLARDKSLREVLATGNSKAVGVWIRAYDEAHHSSAYSVISPEGDFNDTVKTQKGKEAGNAWQSFDAIGKAASIFMDGTPENISAALGTNHKVRNFYNNILNPQDARFTTVDTHATAVAHLSPMSTKDLAVQNVFSGSSSHAVEGGTGINGTYPIYQEAYEQAAALRGGMLPREMQSITWEGVRGMFGEKSDDMRDAVQAIHDQVAAGKISAPEGRRQILKLAPIQDPAWVTRDGEPVLRDMTYRAPRDAFTGTRMAFEVAPDPMGDPELYARWRALPDVVRADISHRVAWRVASMAMATTWKKPDGKPNVITGRLHTQVGGYLEDTNPSLSIELDDNVSGPKAEELTRLLGYALRQHSMAMTAPPRFTRTGKRREPPQGWTHMGAFEVDLGGPKSVQEIRDIYNQLRAADPRITGHSTDANGKMAILVDTGLEDEMAAKAHETLAERYNVNVVDDGLDVNWPSTEENEYGFRQTEDLQSGSPLREQADRLRDAATAQLNAELDRAESGIGRTAESPVGTEHSVQPQRGPLRQENEGQSPRGEINVRDGHAIIKLFKSSDASTPIHELGHLWLEELIADAKRPNAPQQIKDDLATALKWMGVETPEQIDVSHHEMWARGFERYLMEGKAPSTALARVFSRMKGWLTAIYKSVQALNSPISDDVRGVFDRLLATDDQIEAAQNRSGLKPAFESAEQAGMTKAEWAAYLKQIDSAKAAAEGTLLEKAMASVRRSRTAEWKEQAAQYRPAVEEQVDSRPDVAAWNALKSKGGLGGEKVSRETVEVNYPGMAEKLPRGFLVGKPDGMHIEHAAEAFGFDNGGDLLNALAKLKEQEDQLRAAGDAKSGIRDYLVDQALKEKMDAEHGDIQDPQSMLDEATAAVHSEQQQQLMATEIRYLRRTAASGLVKTGKVRKEGEAKLSAAEQKLADLKETQRWDDAEAAAQKERMKAAVAFTNDMLNGMRVHAATILAGRKPSDSQPSKYLRDERSAAREVQKALLAGDAAGAAAAKQRQLLSSILYTEAKRNADYLEKTTAAMQRLAAKPTFDRLDQHFVDQLHGWLQSWGMSVKRDPGELQRALLRDGVTTQDGALDQPGTFDKFIRERFDAGTSFPYDTWMSKGGDLEALKFSQFQQLGELFKAVRAMARAEQTVTEEGKEVARDIAVSELTSSLKSRFDEKEGSEYATEDMRKATEQKMRNLGSFLRSMNSSLLMKESLFDWWGGEGRDNPWERYIMRPLRDAQYRKRQMTDETNARLAAVEESMPKGWADHLRDMIADHNLAAPNGKQMKIDRKAMLKIALYWGAQDSADKLARGYKWDHQDIQDLLDRNMRPEDWKFVQGIWSMYEAYKQPLDDMQRRVNGVGLKMVEERVIQTSEGPIQGKYFPLDYDRVRSRKADTLGQKNAEEALFGGNYFRPETPNGSVIARVSGVDMPLDLSLDTALRRLGQTIHDLAFREAIIQADKLLEDPKVAGMIESTWGREYQKLFRPWLRAIANSASAEEDAVGWLNKTFRWARMNSVIVGIGFRLSTVLKHGSSAAINSQAELGHWFERGLAEAYFNPWAKDSAWNMAIEKSHEVRYRLNQYDRDTQEQLLKTIGGVSTIDAFKNVLVHYSHMPVAMLDYGSAVPTFIGAYRRAQAKGLSEEDAIYEADKVVRQAHGSQTPLDQSAFQQTNNEAAKLIGAFYGFFNHVYNRQADTIRKAKAIPGQVAEGNISGASRNFMLVLMRTLGYVAAPGLASAYISTGGPDEDKGDGWWGWAAKAIATELPAGIPLLRDLAKAAIEGRDYEPSPVVHMVNTFLAAGKDANRGMEDLMGIEHDKQVSTRWIQHMSDGFGYFTGLPTGQAGASAQFLWDYAHDEEDPQSISDWVRGLARGTLKPPKG